MRQSPKTVIGECLLGFWSVFLSDANNKRVIKNLKKTDGKEHVRQTEWEEGPQLHDGKVILMSQWLHRLNHTLQGEKHN